MSWQCRLQDSSMQVVLCEKAKLDHIKPHSLTFELLPWSNRDSRADYPCEAKGLWKYFENPLAAIAFAPRRWLYSQRTVQEIPAKSETRLTSAIVVQRSCLRQTY